MRKQLALLAAGSLLIMSTAASAANKAETFSFSPVIGGYLFDGKQHLKGNIVYGVRAGYNFTDAFGVEALFDYLHNNDSTLGPKPGISMFRYGGEMLYHFFPENKFVPYVAAGYAGVHFDGDSDGISNKNYTQTRGAFDYGVGAKYFLNDNVAIRADVRHLVYTYDRTYSNVEYTLGAYIPFGGTAPAAKPAEPPPAPAAAPVVAPPPPPVPVAPLDSDGDGVPDAGDNCPGTPAGVKVDKDGCPLDSDMDGVADYLDKCPGTPVGVKVDKDGCPLDSDMDGVADYLDKCPGTPAGVKVDTDGCPVPVAKLCSPTVLNITFDTNKSDIKPQYHNELKAVADFLKEFPTAKGVIEGHTDNVGSAASNMKLSQRRADSVRSYLIKTFGIAPARVTAKGYGLTKPVADNKTAAGKQQNRRIEANFTCGGM